MSGESDKIIPFLGRIEPTKEEKEEFDRFISKLDSDTEYMLDYLEGKISDNPLIRRYQENLVQRYYENIEILKVKGKN